MQLHDRRADVRLERGVVVGEFGQRVLRHVLFFLSALRQALPGVSEGDQIILVTATPARRGCFPE
jgi:hypothetical protein